MTEREGGAYGAGMTTPPNLPPAGWYPSPENRDLEQFWDGRQWTQKARAAQSAPPPPLSPPPNVGPAALGQRLPAQSLTPARSGALAAVLRGMLRHPILSILGVLLLVGVVSGVSTSGGSSDSTTAAAPPAIATTHAPTLSDARQQCTKVTPARQRGLAGGLRKGVRIVGSGYFAPVGDDAPGYGAFAFDVQRGQDERVVVIAAPLKEGGALTLDTESALPYFNWGDMAQQGSPVDKLRDKVFASDAATVALTCARGY